MTMGSTTITQQLTDPDRTVVTGTSGVWKATFTNGARTVTLAGPARTFAEEGITVTHDVWVRCLSQPYTGTVDDGWLAAALGANEAGDPDILALAMQYIRGAPVRREGTVRIAGDAGYGPLVNGRRQEGSDFGDYLGIPWVFPDDPSPPDNPEPCQFRCLDCSGYIRMVWGFRRHLPGAEPLGAVPLSRGVAPDALPRRAHQMCTDGPGVPIAPDTGVRLTDLSRLAIGDLVFFKADPADPAGVDHVGLYLGLDGAGERRFLSSRKGANGPTLADRRGKSVLDGAGLYARGLRAVRRL